MAIAWRRLLPAKPDGPRNLDGPFWMFVVVASVGSGRSLVHMLAPDGGAQSIAGIRVDVVGGSNIIALFAQWGASQLILALIYWVVIVRYRALVPLMWLVVLGEQGLRLLAGHIRPLLVDKPPPGAYGTYVLLPLAFVILVWSLWDDGA